MLALFSTGHQILTSDEEEFSTQSVKKLELSPFTHHQKFGTPLNTTPNTCLHFRVVPEIGTA